MPAVYVMDAEEGINAFAAGFNTSDAVIGVTRGTMNLLTRDELQGVVAHEFSHIFNGDMRLNLRLVGVLHGILLLSLIGYFLMRVILEMRPGRGSSCWMPHWPRCPSPRPISVRWMCWSTTRRKPVTRPI